MVLDQDIAKKTAGLLLQINAIKLEPENPFTWASGWKSPIYCDNRVILSHPKIRDFVRRGLAEQLRDRYGTPDLIAGVATGAIGIGILVADVLDLPFIYVRPEPKSHGRQNQIEGQFLPGQRCVVIEDLISTGKSSLGAVRALREQGLEVAGMLAIFSYGFPIAQSNFKGDGVELHTLSDYDHLIEQAAETDYIKASQMQALMQWRADPQGWKK